MLHEMNDPKIQHLSKVPLFANCTKKELEFLATRADEVDVPGGKALTRQGRSGDTFYVMLDGQAEVEIDGKHRGTLKTGDFFGEIGMLDLGPATATVTTKGKAQLLVMSHAQFRDAIKANDGLLVKVLRAMGQRLRADLDIARAGNSNPAPG